MSLGLKFGLPTDIPWKRVCVTREMLDPKVCDPDFPPKWNSSIAVFRYDPDEEEVDDEEYRISYLKVSITITGYQPHDKEIEGSIDWDGLSVETLADVEALLSEYHPCTGALLQVGVSPKGRNKGDVEQYPFFMDFEPKKRQLFEMATDTKERVSRSLERLNVGKSASSSESTEVLDIDMGGSVSGGISVFEVGGASFSSSTQGQWGTKSVGSNESAVQRSTDHSQEKQESQAFSTSISQLYHLLDSYHLGTNRALFFIQPRPHVIEESSGFVRGPRPIDGIQEFFMIVARPKKQDDYCVSVRLDTAHLAETDIMGYDRKTDSFQLSTSASIPSKNDPNATFEGYRYLDVSYGPFGSGRRRYRCISRTATDNEIYTPPWSGYRIDTTNGSGYSATPTNNHGSYSISVAGDGTGLTASVSAKAHRCYDDGGSFCLDCPDYLSSSSYAGYSNLSVLVRLISEEPIIKIGTDQVLLITTRGLCCCEGEHAVDKPSKGIISMISIKDLIAKRAHAAGLLPQGIPKSAHEAVMGLAGPGSTEPPDRDDVNTTPIGMPIRVANALGDMIRGELQTAASLSSRRRPAVPYLHSEYFLGMAEARLRRRALLTGQASESAEYLLAGIDEKKICTYFGKNPDEVTKRDLRELGVRGLADALSIDAEHAASIRLCALGLASPRKSKSASER